MDDEMEQDYLTHAFIRIRQKLKAISGRMLPDPDGAEDILQDAFVRLWRRQYPLRSEKEAEALLAKAVKNASLNERRKARAVPLPEDIEDDPPDEQDKEAAFAGMNRLIDTKISALQKYILEEKEYGGRTLEDIAKELGMEPAATRMQLSRARKTLREFMGNEQER